jgi:hypothetical protein
MSGAGRFVGTRAWQLGEGAIVSTFSARRTDA